MLNFNFTEEQDAFSKILQDFAKTDLLPNYMKWDREGKFPYEVWGKMGKLGLTGLRVQEKYHGSSANCVMTGIAALEVGKGDFNAAYAVLLNGLISEILEEHASDEIKDEWLKPMAIGEKLLGIAITEPGAGSDAASLKTSAIKDGDTYILSGEKSGISLAKFAHGFLVFAKTDPSERARGISAFMVPADAEGIEIQTYEDMGNVPIGRGSVFLNDVRIPESYLVGEENKGFYQVMNGFDLSRILIALQCIGAAEQSIEETIEHVKTRKSFGKPLAMYQGVQFPIVEHHTWLEMTKWLCFRALWLRDEGLPHTKEASMCKWMGPQLAREAIHECLLLNGHYGYTKEMAIEQRLRDVIGLEIGDGTAQTQKFVIAREIIGKEFRAY